MRCASRAPDALSTPRRSNGALRILGALLGLGLALAPLAALAAEPPAGLLSITSKAAPTLDWDAAVQTLSRSDVVFLGEQHDDPATHRLERSLLEALHQASRKRLLLSLEMFERDVQPVLDAYLAGRITEVEFMAKARPWPNYVSDYRPMIEYAKANGIRVIAANVPRPIASKVAKEGLEALQTLPPDQRAWAAAQVDVPKNQLWERFQETMKDHPGMSATVVERMYMAQSLKDATMAESLAGAFTPDSPATVVLHVNGAFHSDEGLGVPAQLKRLRPELVTTVTTVRPVAPGEASPSAEIADLIFLVRRD